MTDQQPVPDVGPHFPLRDADWLLDELLDERDQQRFDWLKEELLRRVDTEVADLQRLLSNSEGNLQVSRQEYVALQQQLESKDEGCLNAIRQALDARDAALEQVRSLVEALEDLWTFMDGYDDILLNKGDLFTTALEIAEPWMAGAKAAIASAKEAQDA